MKLRELSIIQYQNVSPTPQVYKLWLSLDSFKRQLEYLATHDFQLLSIDEALDFMEKKRSVEHGRPISLTFDNGYQDFQEQSWSLWPLEASPGMHPLRRLSSNSSSR